MTDEIINIVIREDGSRVVKRNLDDMADSANKANTGINTLKNSMKGGANDLQKFIDETTGVSREIKSAADSAAVFQKALNPSPLQNFKNAMKETEKGAISSRAAFEGLVLVHEGLSGNIRRMVGSLLIEAQALAGAERTTAAISFLMNPLVLGIIAVSIALIAGAALWLHYAEAQRQMVGQALGIGAAAGATTEMIKAEGEAASASAQQTTKFATQSVQAFAAVGVQSATTREQLAELVPAYATLTNEKPAEAQKELAKAMSDAGQGAIDMSNKISFLSGAQLEEIERLQRMGDKQGAVNLLTKDFKEWAEKAAGAGAKFASALQSIWSWGSSVVSVLGQVEQAYLGLGFHSGTDTKPPDPKKQLSVQQLAALNAQSRAGVDLINQTPEEQDRQQKETLEGNIAVLKRAQAANLELSKSQQVSAAERAASLVEYQKDTAALAEYTHALTTHRSELEKKVALDRLDAQITEARRKHNAGLVTDLERQKTLVQRGGLVESDADAQAYANASGERAGATVGAAKQHKDTIDQLRSQAAALLNQVDPVEASLLRLAKDQDTLTKAIKAGLLPASDQVKYMKELKDQAIDSILGPIIDKLNPAATATRELTKAQQRLDEMVQAGAIPKMTAALAMDRLRESYEKALDPLKKMTDELDDQIKLAGMDQHEREIYTELYQRYNEALTEGNVLGLAELDILKHKLEVLKATNEAQGIRDKLLGESVEKRRLDNENIQVVGDLANDPSSQFTKDDAFRASAQQLSAGGIDLSRSKQAQAASLAQYKEYYALIQQMRAANSLDEQSAQMAIAQLDQQQMQQRLQFAGDFFGQLATLSSSKNKELAAIGKAAAMAQAGIDGVLAVQKALATYPPPFDIAMAAVVAAAAAANIAKIAGFESGGYTGDTGTSSIAGVVHGQEFVFDAAATRRIGRESLEAMRRGAVGPSPSAQPAGSQRSRVIVQQHPGVAIETQERTDGEIEIIAKRVVRREAPTVVAADVKGGHNSQMSKALSHAYGMKRSDR